VSWTTIPRWLYENDLPDDQLQRRYVEQAEGRLAACVEDRIALEEEVAALRAMERGTLSAEEWSALAGELGEPPWPAMRGAGVARSTRAAHPLLTVRSLVVSAHKGREVVMDVRPTCQHCGRRVGNYMPIPWSVRCPECRKQASRD
jgi:Ni,Fe-hydrogenase III large subunit